MSNCVNNEVSPNTELCSCNCKVKDISLQDLSETLINAATALTHESNSREILHAYLKILDLIDTIKKISDSTMSDDSLKTSLALVQASIDSAINGKNQTLDVINAVRQLCCAIDEISNRNKANAISTIIVDAVFSKTGPLHDILVEKIADVIAKNITLV